MDNSNSKPISSSTSTSTKSTSSPATEQKNSSTPPSTSPKNVGGDQANATKSTDVVKENKVISAS
jgi:hypothetical protein